MSLLLNAPKKARILVVEDEAIVARDICLQLSEQGYEPLADTPRGEEAIELTGKLRPDLVLMDVSLAGDMDGITAARTIRERFAVPVVFLTAFTGRETLERAKDAEPFGYIIKPFDEQDLRTVIEMALFKHEAEARLRASEEKLRRLAVFPELNPNPVMAFGADGMLNYSNPAALAMARKVGLASVAALLPPETPRILAECLATDQPRLRLETRHGARTISWSFYPLTALQIVHCYAGDITERKQAEASIRLQSAALEAATNSVVITDTLGHIEWVNPAFCRVTGYALAEVIGQNPRVLKSGRQPAEYYAEMWRTICAGRSWQGEFVNRRKDGSFYTEAVSIAPVLDEQGKIAHFLAIKQDISALKQSLSDLERAHAELGEKNRALDAALVEARTAVETKATFLATMSHEIRTPMNGVIGMASLLRESAPLTEVQVDYVETIRSSGETLLTLINDVLDFSKIESDNLELERIPFDLRRCLEETLEALAPRAREKLLDLAVEIDPSVPPVIAGDGVRLRQVITNLAGNAVKFTDKGEVVVEVRAKPAPGGLHRIFFRVRDSGIGIPADKIGRLFKPFSQVDSSTTRVYGGTGLGLAISQRLVGLMGGTIEVVSEPGRGSTFFFAITVASAPATAPFDRAPVPADLVGCSVLIVDDHATNRRIFSAQLRQAGCLTAEAASGAEGLDWLESHAWPDLILTDMLMPGMDGLDFVLNVRAREIAKGITPPVPVMMVSSGGYQPSDPRAAGARLAVALSKPLRRQQLIEAAARACALVPAPRTSRKAAPIIDNLQGVATQHPRRILLAEDNPVNRKVARAIFGRMGYEIDVAVNGLEAVEACRTKVYDLVFMDVQMPEIDGLEATRRIRQLPGPQHVVIIAITANAMEGDRETCLAAGMDDYISKPVKIEDVHRAIIAARPGPK